MRHSAPWWRRIALALAPSAPPLVRRLVAVAAAPPPQRRESSRGGRPGAARWSLAAAAVLNAALIGGAVAAGALRAPGPVGATGWQPSSLTAERFEPSGLQEVHERLERQRELQRAARSHSRALAAATEALRRQHQRLSQVLESQRRRARSLEQQLDYHVPRLLARQAEVRARRARTAQALTELAARSRGVHLDSKLRARMLAISPFVLDQLRSIESSLGSVGHAERTIERHARIARSLADLTTARQRVSGRLAEKRWLRQAALERLRELDADVGRLADEQVRLAHRVLGAEAGIATSAGPAGVGEAAVAGVATARGVLEGRPRWDRVPDAEHRSASTVSASALAARLAAPAALTGSAGWLAMPPPLVAAVRRESPRISPGASHDAISSATPLEVAFEPPRRLPAMAAILGYPPLVPVAAAAARDRVAAPDRPAMSMAAAPGQGVAAPVDGRIVFAGGFKSYGLLLIIEHEREYHTLLWGFAWLDVSPGDHVQAGQVVGIMGARGNDPPVLHVERRRHGRPINLAASSSGIQG